MPRTAAAGCGPAPGCAGRGEDGVRATPGTWEIWSGMPCRSWPLRSTTHGCRSWSPVTVVEVGNLRDRGEDRLGHRLMAHVLKDVHGAEGSKVIVGAGWIDLRDDGRDDARGRQPGQTAGHRAGPRSSTGSHGEPV